MCSSYLNLGKYLEKRADLLKLLKEKLSFSSHLKKKLTFKKPFRSLILKFAAICS